MEKVIGVQFKRNGKIYYFRSGNFKVNLKDNVIVETTRGIEYGEVVIVDREINENDIGSPLKDIIRIATEEDKAQNLKNKEKEKEAIKVCAQKIKEHKLQMNLIDGEYTFDNNKILFYFTAEGRIDFRELVKDLASIFRTRIELRQVGVRDETKMMDGIGVCGRRYCCSGHLTEFVPVSIKMAKEQNLSLNPIKISGCCGRLMCCLKYEQEVYDDKLKRLPKLDAIIDTPDGQGTVVDVNILKETVKVKLDSESETIKIYDVKDIKIIKNGKQTSKTLSDENDVSIEELRQLED